LESRTEERAVQIGDRWFVSKTAVRAFILTEMGSDDSGVGLLALDGVSVFQLMLTYTGHHVAGRYALHAAFTADDATLVTLFSEMLL
jgi:hypothetical protein